MKAYLIDPFKMTITEIERENDYSNITPLISPEPGAVNTFDCVRIHNDDVIYVDDEGLLKQNNFFEYEDYHSPLAGIGLVMGTTGDGESCDPVTTLDQLKAKIQWATPFRLAGANEVHWMRVNALKMEQEAAAEEAAAGGSA